MSKVAVALVALLAGPSIAMAQAIDFDAIPETPTLDMAKKAVDLLSIAFSDVVTTEGADGDGVVVRYWYWRDRNEFRLNVVSRSMFIETGTADAFEYEEINTYTGSYADLSIQAPWGHVEVHCRKEDDPCLTMGRWLSPTCPLGDEACLKGGADRSVHQVSRMAFGLNTGENIAKLILGFRILSNFGKAKPQK